MSTHTNNDGQEFEVTEADRALVAPLGVVNPLSEEDQRALLTDHLKVLISEMAGKALPTGFWDAFLDEGDTQCGVPDCPDGDLCCNGDHHILTRPSDPARDDVFVRLSTDVGYEPIWDIGVYTRNRTPDGGTGTTAIPMFQTGEEVTPEQVINDLGVLLAVFRLFVQQGRL